MTKRGRPPKNPIDFLKAKVLTSAIEMYNPKLNTGYQLEKFFEPDRFKGPRLDVTRKCNWDRYRNGVVPSKKWIRAIKQYYPRAIDYFDSPLWTAMRAGEQSEQYWSDFYLNLSVRLRNICYQFKSGGLNGIDGLNTQKKKALHKLVRIGTHESTACLIALYRENKFKNNFIAGESLVNTLHHEALWLLSYFPFCEYSHEIFDYLKKYVVILSDRPKFLVTSCPFHEMSFHQVAAHIEINQKNTLLAEDIGLAMNPAEQAEFRYFKYRGDKTLIVYEMAELYTRPDFILSHAKKGLRWLIKKMKKVIINRHDKYVSIIDKAT